MTQYLEKALRSVDLDAQMRSGRRRLRFSGALEAAYQQDTGESRRYRFHRTTRMSLVTYNVFLLGDYILVPDMMRLSLTLHLAVVTPFLCVVALLLLRPLRPHTSELLAASLPLAMVLQVVVIFALSRAPEADHYQYFVALIAMFANAVLRLRFRVACVVSALIMGIHAFAVMASPNLTAPAAAMATMALATAICITLISNSLQEGEYRRDWLRRRSSELRNLDLTRENTELSQLSRIDPLTGVTNRRGFELAVEQFHAIHAGVPPHFCVIMIDVDHFKSYNDYYGHGAGDACLKDVARIATQCLRSSGEILARFGGEEFVVFLPHCRLAEGAQSAERIRRALVSAAIEHKGKMGGTVVTASLGVAEARLASMVALHDAIAKADTALYDAKRAGRNRVEPPLVKKLANSPTDAGDDLREVG